MLLCQGCGPSKKWHRLAVKEWRVKHPVVVRRSYKLEIVVLLKSFPGLLMVNETYDKMFNGSDVYKDVSECLIFNKRSSTMPSSTQMHFTTINRQSEHSSFDSLKPN